MAYVKCRIHGTRAREGSGRGVGFFFPGGTDGEAYRPDCLELRAPRARRFSSFPSSRPRRCRRACPTTTPGPRFFSSLPARLARKNDEAYRAAAFAAAGLPRGHAIPARPIQEACRDRIGGARRPCGGVGRGGGRLLSAGLTRSSFLGHSGRLPEFTCTSSGHKRGLWPLSSAPLRWVSSGIPIARAHVRVCARAPRVRTGEIRKTVLLACGNCA